jgi:hypothetical protein
MGWAQEPECGGSQALAGLREVRRLLRRPEAAALTASIPYLATAIRHLSALESQLRGQPPAIDDRPRICVEIRQLESELRHVNALMESAGRFYAGLGQLLAATGGAAGYNPRGQLEARAAGPRLLVQG